MSDIVERLRDYATTGNRPSLWPAAMREAADEIDRLRAINAELLKALHLVWKRIDLLEPIGAQDIQQIRAAISKAINPVEQIIPSRCPTCNSPQPHLHPAVQFEGEVHVCADKWHVAAISKATNPVTAAIASGRAPTMEEVAEVVEESDAVAGERG